MEGLQRKEIKPEPEDLFDFEMVDIDNLEEESSETGEGLPSDYIVKDEHSDDGEKKGPTMNEPSNFSDSSQSIIKKRSKTIREEESIVVKEETNEAVAVDVKGKKLFDCELCERKFERRNSLKVHKVDVHEKSGAYACGFCNKAFYYKYARDVHERRHGGEKLYICDKCESSFYSKSNLSDHVKTHIKVNDVELEIAQHYTEKTNGRYTEITKSGSGRGHFQCELCKIIVRGRSGIKCHIIDVHEKSGAYACGFCDKSFYYKGARNEHQKKHSGEKSVCDDCGKSFDTRSNLNQHVKTHGIRSKSEYFCEICYKKFSRERVLKQHVRNMHEGESIRCNICDKTFARKDNLKRHMQDIHERAVTIVSMEKSS